MSTTIDDSSFEGFDRTLLSLSSKMEEPFYWAYGMIRHRLLSVLDPNKFDNATSKVAEIAKRVFMGLFAAASLIMAGTHLLFTAVIWGAVCKVFRSIGFALQKNGFTHIRGLSPEKELDKGEISTMIWNVRGQRGGIHYAQGGVVHWRSRLDQIVEKIQKEDVDVLILQEIDDVSFVEALVSRLQDQYAHFYTHFKGGGVVLSKCAVNEFSHTNFANEGRGFETLELKASPLDAAPCVRIMTAQVPEESFGQIVHALEKQEEAFPTLFIGNVRQDAEGGSLSQYLYHSYRAEEPTHTGQLLAQWNPKLEEGETVEDFVSLFKRNLSDGRTLPVVEKNIRLLDSHLVRAFDETYNTQTALSDHHGVVARIGGLVKIN